MIRGKTYSLILLLSIKLVQFLCFLFKHFIKPKPKSKSILFLPAFFPENAGYHWRVTKWSELLQREGYNVKILAATNKQEFYSLRQSNHNRFLFRYLWRRFAHIIKSRHYQTVIVRRELLLFNDYGNLFMEKFLLLIHPNAILDFDDDLAASKGQPKIITNWYARLMGEHGNKFNESLRLYKRFIVASNYLKGRVLHENNDISADDIMVIPTCVDYDQYPTKQYPEQIREVTFGWIGGDHNYPQLRRIIPFLNDLSKAYNFKLIVIGSTVFKSDANFDVEFISWSLETEVEDLYKIDIGLMPLEENEVTKGKGGFKLIQYMGLGIVSVASGITINKEIVSDSKDGFLVDEESDWMQVLNNVLTQKENYSEIGELAALKIKKNYSFTGNSSEYVHFIEKNSCL